MPDRSSQTTTVPRELLSIAARSAMLVAIAVGSFAGVVLLVWLGRL